MTAHIKADYNATQVKEIGSEQMVKKKYSQCLYKLVCCRLLIQTFRPALLVCFVLFGVFRVECNDNFKGLGFPGVFGCNLACFQGQVPEHDP